MKRTFLVICTLFSLCCQPWLAPDTYADETITDRQRKGWQFYKNPSEAGFSAEKLEKAKAYWQSLLPDAAAIFVAYKGKALIDWGDTEYKFMCHSVRKSFLSALYGIHVGEGNIDLEKTMAELNIDDDPPLWEEEKQAKVVHLLKARSGVYHEAAAEAPEMKEGRPERGSHPPDTFWYYNNWDFNSLGTIFRQETGKDIFVEFKRRIARPIGMQDYKASDGHYSYELMYSIHPAYPFRMSARDRAKFGQLFLQKGRWGDKQIIPGKWVKRSTKAYSDASEGQEELRGVGYGYMWWTIAKDSVIFNYWKRFRGQRAFLASGYRGHLIMVLPNADMVYVLCVNTDLGVFNVEVEFEEAMILLNKIFAAKEFETIDLAILKTWLNVKTAAAGDEVKLFVKVKNLSREESAQTTVDFYLSNDKNFNGKDKLIGSAALPDIASGKKTRVSLNTSLPKGIKAGTYYLIAYVDEQNLNFDPDTDNNICVSVSRLTIR